MTMPKYPTCPNCGENVLREHLNKGDEVCRFCGPTRDLDTYGELEKERFDNWFNQYQDDQLDKVQPDTMTVLKNLGIRK